MTTWFTSDWHIGHNNIIEYSDRPFESVEHMNDRLIELHNELVAPDDHVYVLGDVVMGKKAVNLPRVAEFNGILHLIAGNHDGCWSGATKNKPTRHANQVTAYLEAGFSSVDEEMVTRIGDHHVVLSHFPYDEDERHGARFNDYLPKDNGAWLVHGHVHNLWRQKDRQINAGVDVWDYRPVHEDQILDLIAAGPQHIDLHGNPYRG